MEGWREGGMEGWREGGRGPLCVYNRIRVEARAWWVCQGRGRRRCGRRRERGGIGERGGKGEGDREMERKGEREREKERRKRDGGCHHGKERLG